MSDDEDLMTDRRGIKRAHESPQKINSLFEGQALDVGDECSVESDDYPEDWNEHFKQTIQKATTRFVERFDRFVIDFKSTKYHIPDKGLRVLDEDGIVIVFLHILVVNVHMGVSLENQAELIDLFDQFCRPSRRKVLSLI